jgi:thiamine pyrophosphate-dependent acetolactate synthase large subunit-like protein
VDVAVLGDARETAHDLLGELRGRGHQVAGWRSTDVAARVAGGSARSLGFEDRGDAEHIDPRVLSLALDEALPRERTVVVDSGHFMGYPSMYLQVPDAAGFVFAQGFQSVGLGLANAFGFAVARPDRLTVAVLGDGGLLMGLAELETAVRLALPLLVVVYNDAAYGAEVHHFGPGGAPLDTVQFPDTDLAEVARGVGAEGLTVRRRTDLTALGKWLASGRERPLLVDAKVVPTVAAEWLQEAFRSH